MSLLALLWIELFGFATVLSASQAQHPRFTACIGLSLMIAGLLI